MCESHIFFVTLQIIMASKSNMNKSFRILIIITLLAFCAPIHAQDNPARKYIVSAFAAINKGDCSEAKRCYNTWKSQTGETNAEIEKMIRECFAQNPEKDSEYEPVPNTSLWITKKPVAKRVTFAQAMEKCAELDYGGFDDWRMPTTNELFVIFAAGKNHGRTFAGMSFDANNRIIRGNTTVKEYDVMRPDGTTSHRSTYSKDNLPFDCFCVRDTISN